MTAQNADKVSKKPEAQKRLEELIRIASRVAAAKGWFIEVDSQDEELFRYATVHVEKNFGSNAGIVTAAFEISCHTHIQISGANTSFHSNGVKDLREAIWQEFTELPWIKPKSTEEKTKTEINFAEVVSRILRRFHRSSRELKHRYNDRDGITIDDEYDAQDYLRAILRAFFDDIRSEEYTPSYAGGASRIDFLLKEQEIAIELKMASPSLKDRKVGEQLIIDIQRYQSHPNCKILFCLVYDPDGYIRNPDGLEADLTKMYDKLDVRVIIVSPA